MNTASLQEHIAQLHTAIAAQEGLRASLGDGPVDTTIAILRRRIAELESQQEHLDESQSRKQVTVLFANVRGFDVLADRLDAEQVSDVLNALWQRTDGIIVAHAGSIDKHTGEGLMAVWGGQAAREDDPEQAIRAALSMQLDVGRWKAAIESQLGTRGDVQRLLSNVQLCIGLNTGPVLLGRVGATGEFTAMGDAVNVASRLADAAPGGGILISLDTYRHVRGVFDVQALDPLRIKGKAEPVQVCQVVRAKPRAFRKGTHGIEGVETSLVGRAAELQRLQAAFHTMLAERHSRALIIVGEIGLGKSRLLHEFDIWSELQPQEFYLFKGQASQETSHTPYALLRAVFSFRFQILDDDPLPVLRDKLEHGLALGLGQVAKDELRLRAYAIGYLLGFSLDDSPYAQAHDEQGQSKEVCARALAYVGDYFASLAAQDPVLILLEDLHDADHPSLQALDFILQATAQQRLLMVGTARPALFEHYPAEGAAMQTRLELGSLSSQDVERLVDDILQKMDGVPVPLRNVLLNNAEGSPFFVFEFIKMLLEEGVIVKETARWRFEPARLSKARVPPTLSALMQARLHSVTLAERVMLQRASVIGQAFWDDAVRHLGARAGGDEDAAWDALCRREMIFRRDTSTFAGTREYVFKNALLRETAYESVLRRERGVYHARAAEWLMAHSGERADEYAGVIAHHLEMAGQAVQAAECLRRAGERALQVSANRDGLDLFERAAALVLADSREQIALVLGMALALTELADFARARACLERAAALARQYGEEASLARAVGGLGYIAMQQGFFDFSRTWMLESLAHARQSEDDVAIARALTNLGWINFMQGAYADSGACFEEGLALVRAANDRLRGIQARNGLGCVALVMGDYEKAQACFQDNLALYREFGSRQGMAEALCNLGETCKRQGDYVAAEAYTRQCIELYAEAGDRLGVTIGLGNLGQIVFAQKDYVAARRFYLEGLREAVAIEATPSVVDMLAGLAGVLAQAGQAERALELLGLARAHPALLDDSRQQLVEPALDRLRSQLPPGALEAGLARGQALDLQATAQDVLGEGDGYSENDE